MEGAQDAAGAGGADSACGSSVPGDATAIVHALHSDDRSGAARIIRRLVDKGGAYASLVLHATIDKAVATGITRDRGKVQLLNFILYYAVKEIALLSKSFLRRLLDCSANDDDLGYSQEIPLTNSTLRAVFDAAVGLGDAFETRFGDTEVTYACRIGHFAYLERLSDVTSVDELRKLLTARTLARIRDGGTVPFAQERLGVYRDRLCTLPADHNSNQPVHYAARCCQSNCISWLVAYSGGNVFAETNARGATALHCAVEGKNDTHLFVDAVLRSHPYHVLKVIDRTFRPSACCAAMTPVQNAIRVGNYNAAEVLMLAGAALTASDVLNLVSMHPSIDCRALTTMRKAPGDRIDDALRARSLSVISSDEMRTRPALLTRLALLYPSLVGMIAAQLKRIREQRWRVDPSDPSGSYGFDREIANQINVVGRNCVVESKISLLRRLPFVASSFGAYRSRYCTLERACVAVTADRLNGLDSKTCAARAFRACPADGLASAVAIASLITFIAGPSLLPAVVSTQCSAQAQRDTRRAAQSAVLARNMVIAARVQDERRSCGPGAAGAGFNPAQGPYSALSRVPWHVRDRIVMYYVGIPCNLFFACCGSGVRTDTED